MGGLRPASLYPLPPQYGAYTSLGMEQLAAWHQASMYQQGVRAASPYSLPLSSSSPLTPPISRYSLPPHHPGLPFPHLPPHHLPHVKSDFDRPPGLMHPDDKVSPCSQKGCAVLSLTGHCFQDNHSPKKKEPHIKKPLNAFMLYMKVITALHSV